MRTAALRAPHRAALVAGTQRLSFRELDAEVTAWAGRLRARGVGPGTRVALLAWNGLAPVALLFAAARLGASLAPLNARLARPELEALVGRLRPQALLAEEALADRLPEAERLEAVAQEPSSPPLGEGKLSLDADWAVLFTSGTTGQPKGARLSVRAFLASAAASRANLASTQEDCWLCNLPLFHVGGLAMAVRCAVDGAALVLHRRFDGLETARALSEQPITHLSLVARTLAVALDAGARPGRLRAVLVGGGALAPELAARARGAGFPVLQTYGLTEACSQVTTERPAEADGTTVGPTLPGLRVRIAGAEGAGANAGGEGEIQVQGPTLMAGYLDDAEASARALAGGWLHTGDVGRLDAQGRLQVLARRLDLILSGGENVYPAEVEAVLSAHPAVAEAAVVGRPDAAWGEVPVAAVVLRAGARLDGLLEWAAGRLARFKVPAEAVAVAGLPRTAAEKVDRVALREQLAAHFSEAKPANGKRAL
ncbi:MAG: o-succinylbenzoate--CoA ligase [Myxococcaceae bacterium]